MRSVSKMDEKFERALFLIEEDGVALDDSLAGLSKAEVERIKPMLEAVLSVREQAADLPAPVEKAANKARFLAEMAELREAAPTQSRGLAARLRAGYRNLWRSGLTRSIVATTTALALTGGVATAAGSSGPASPLYPIKRAVETVEVAMARSDFAQSRLHLRLAEKRLAELGAERHGDSETNKELSLEILRELARVRGLAAGLSPAEKPEVLQDYDELEKRYEERALLERQDQNEKRTRPPVDKGLAPTEPSGGEGRPESRDSDDDSDKREDDHDDGEDNESNRKPSDAPDERSEGGAKKRIRDAGWELPPSSERSR